ncbi:cation diffusion facilitator family transporter [Anaerotalea alkaliphila]|uniref:Cation transporter n=1 Tax=Anaerotalea alkaliphila TaxID=2662126 RepID=A0A7X5KMM5_9FIRM|nr:cation diffusion facilitator family transporter [Anaerotalea alkaliphila]NDL67109.1 cation transporter [Anaerotalea alkaliphila]
MHKHIEERNKMIHRVGVLGILGNILLLVSKLVVGLSSGSQAMIGDGLNSAGDVFSSLMTLIGNRIAGKPHDEDHPYGHGKAEYVFSMIISFSLLLVSFGILRNSLDSILNRDTFLFSYGLVAVALGTILVKILLFLYSHKVGLHYSSLLALANAEDHRNDVFITLFTLLSIVTGYFEIYVVDGVVGMGISLWIAFTGVKIFSSAYEVLMDTNIDEKVKKEIYESILVDPKVDHVDSIVSKPVGLNFLLIVKISLDGNMTVYEGHLVADDIKHRLMEFDHIDDVIVHVNPAQFHPERI